MITKISFYDVSLMKTFWPVSKPDVNRCTRISLLLDFTMKTYHKDLVSSCDDLWYYLDYLY